MAEDGEAVAKSGDQVIGVDTHIVMIKESPVPMPLPFQGQLVRDLAGSVFVDEEAVAVVGSGADGVPHIPPGGPFQRQPSNKGTVSAGSGSVFVEEKSAARDGDAVKCCNDYVDSDTGHIMANSTVFAG
ncbi:MAG: PAAR domain-containing protein [Polyangiaceae bacterium]